MAANGLDPLARFRMDGKVAIVTGREAAKVARPQIVDWLAAHSDED